MAEDARQVCQFHLTVAQWEFWDIPARKAPGQGGSTATTGPEKAHERALKR